MPDLGLATMRPRWPLPMGAMMSIRRLELQGLGRKERREVFKQHAVLEGLGRLAVDGVDLHAREVALVVLGRAHLAFDRVAGVQVEAADLRGRDVDVVGAREVARVRAAQEAEAVGQHLEGAVAEDLFALPGAFLEDGEHELLLAHALRIVDLKFGGHVKQLADVQRFELGKMHGVEKKNVDEKT